jgi:hypothetical protein
VAAVLPSIWSPATTNAITQAEQEARAAEESLARCRRAASAAKCELEALDRSARGAQRALLDGSSWRGLLQGGADAGEG